MSEYHVVVRQGKPYLRRKPYIYKNPTLRQLVHQGRFAKVVYDLFDEAKGYENGLPIVAATVQKCLAGKPLPPPAEKTLDLTPFQYKVLLDQIERRRLEGEDIDLNQILKRQRIRLRVMVPPEITAPPPFYVPGKT